MHIPQGFAAVTPYLVVDGASDYIDFLKSAFGAEEIGRNADPDGRVRNCQLRMGSAMFMLSDPGPGCPATSVYLYHYVADADQSMARAMAAGAVNVLEVANMPYGDRQGGVRDPAGNVWWISERRTTEPYY